MNRISVNEINDNKNGNQQIYENTDEKSSIKQS